MPGPLASIKKVCSTQYTDNPPFLCSTTIAPQPLTVLSLSVSNTLTVSGLLSIFLALILARIFSRYRPSDEEIEEANDGRDWAAALGDVFQSCSSAVGTKYATPASSNKVLAGDEDDHGVELGGTSEASHIDDNPSLRASSTSEISPLDRSSSLMKIIDSFNALLRQNEALRRGFETRLEPGGTQSLTIQHQHQHQQQEEQEGERKRGRTFDATASETAEDEEKEDSRLASSPSSSSPLVTRAELELVLKQTHERMAQLQSTLDRLDRKLLSSPPMRVSSPSRQSPLRALGGSSSRKVFVEEEHVPDGVNSSVTRRWL